METSKLITSLNRTGIGSYTELTYGDASIHLTLAEFDQKRIIDLPYSYKDMISYLWNPYAAGGPVFSANDVSILNDPSTLFVGAPFSHPFKDLKDLKWKLSENGNTGTINDTYVSNPLFIYNNDIKFYNIYDSSSRFILNNTKTAIFLENAYIRDVNNNTWDASTYQYRIYQDVSTEMGVFTLESSLGEKYDFPGYAILYTDASNALLEYAFNNLFNVPLLTFNNFYFIDSSSITHDLSTNYILDIRNGKIGLSDPCINITEYINFNYDTSLNEQLIQHNIIYESDRLPIYVIDPSIYYSKSVADASSIVVDNSIYTMTVNHTGDYNVEVYGWDSYNNVYYNQTSLLHRVWLKTPTIYTITNYPQLKVIDASIISNTDISTNIDNNKFPIYDRLYPMYGTTRKKENNEYYIEIPSITYFQNLPEYNSINRFYNLTERVLDVSGNILNVDINYQNFNIGDSLSIVKYNKSNYDYVSSYDTSISAISGNHITIGSLNSEYLPSELNDIYLINSTFRSVTDISTYYSEKESIVTINNYQFSPNQMINLIVTDNSNNYSWGASYKVKDVSNYVHTLDAAIPDMFLNNSQYSINAKHAFTTYSSTDIKTASASEYYGTFKLHLNDVYNEGWWLDDTFAIINMLFDQTEVNLNWADTSINGIYKKYYSPIISDTSTLVFIGTEFDPSLYMVNKKNIWTVRYNDSKDILFRVHNNIVPYKFTSKGYYDVQLESYDSNGNISTINSEALIKII